MVPGVDGSGPTASRGHQHEHAAVIWSIRLVMVRNSRRLSARSLPLTPRLLIALAVGSIFVATVVANLARTEEIKNATAAQAQRVKSVARGLASRAAPLLEFQDDLRLAMMGASAAQFGSYRVIIIDAHGDVRIDTGLAMGGRRLQLLSAEGAFMRPYEEGKAEFVAPAIGVQGVVGEVRIRFPIVTVGAAGFSTIVFGGCLLACLSLLALAALICHHWMAHVREASAAAQAMAHGDPEAKCERSAGGVIRDLQDSLHDLGRALGDGVQQVQQSFLELALQTVEVLERRGTSGHSERTCSYSLLLAKRLGLTAQECRDLELAARLHDLGEVYEPPENRVHDSEEGAVNRMRRIPQRGAELVEGLPNLKRVAEYMRHHREKFDGSGFPQGLHGERIPLGARILGIADAYDQLTTVCTNRREPMSVSEALATLREDRGETFDPWLVDLFEEEVQRSPAPEEISDTVMISTAGVVPYKVTQTTQEERILEETAFSWGDDRKEWDNELELFGEDVSGGDRR